MRTFLHTRTIRIMAALSVIFGTAGLASLTALSSTTAQADPSFVTAYAGVGADVTQDLYGALGGEAAANSATSSFYIPLHSSAATDNVTIDSFDASPPGGSTVNPGCITTKLSGPQFDRPNSTTNGVAALADSVNGVNWQNTTAPCTQAPTSVTGQIDFARAARGPKGTSTLLTWIPFGRDALGILYFDHGDGNLNNLTTAELTSLYSSSTGKFTINGETTYACLTLSGSTPRSNLETAIGVSDATADAAATAAGCDQLEQNSGDAFYSFASSLPTGSGAIIPISSGSWIGQANGVGVDRSSTARAKGADLANVNGLGQPYTLSGSTEVPSTNYYQNSTYGYNVYTVVPTDEISGNFASAGLESLFVGSSSSLCSSAAQATVHLFGFDSLVSSEGTCGSTTQTGNS